ncbi:MAG TPA: hypothetical protein VL485_33490, partial [Ktedonobacteraceae bacterium]|nr:hypothetical protein [Ktedonobacteraceae bacterium]
MGCNTHRRFYPPSTRPLFWLFCCLSLCIVLFSACGSSTTPASSTPAATPTTAAKGSGNVQVMYAGSL